MITDADIKKMKEVFITKEDSKAFATKNDLKAFATKDDLKAFATKDDLKAFATKNDLKAFATKDDLKAFATKDDLKAFATKENLKDALKDYPTRKEMNNGFMEVINFISETRSEIVGIMTKQLEELKDITRHHQITLEKHDSRITHLEYLNKS